MGKSPLHLALVTETWPPEINGVAMTLSRLAHGVVDRGWQVALVRPEQGFGSEQSSHAGIKETLVPGLPIPTYSSLRFGLPVVGRLIQAWTLQRPHVVHIATEGPLGWAALRAARKLKIPVITSFHTNFHSYCRHYGLNWLNRVASWYLRYFHNRSALTLVPSESMLQPFLNEGYKNVAVLGRGVDTSLFNPSRRDEHLRASWGVRPHDLVALYVGRMAPEKNLKVTATAFSVLKTSHPSARMIWVGDGPSLLEMGHQHPDHIFAGARVGEELARFYASADIFLFPSMTETYGNVVVEAMSSGLAVVAYNYAAAQLNMRHGENGLLSELGDTQAFYNRVEQLGRNPQMVQELGSKAVESAGRMNWNAVMDRYETLVRDVVSGACG